MDCQKQSTPNDLVFIERKIMTMFLIDIVEKDNGNMLIPNNIFSCDTDSIDQPWLVIPYVENEYRRYLQTQMMFRPAIKNKVGTTIANIKLNIIKVD